jgi:ubiquinone/menaquinone biosynthesis C-methylase UbiE
MSWRDYWNSDTPIYVNDHHKAVHYECIANDIVALLARPGMSVLDYGCGEALSADRVAASAQHLYLCDGAPLVCQRLTERFGALGNVTVLSPEEMDRIPPGSLDLIVVNSLIQYLKRPELEIALAIWRNKLARSGRLLVADVIPRDVGPLTDALALLKLAAGNGFLIAALAGLVRTVLSDYSRIRAELGLSQYSEAEILAVLDAAGFDAIRHHPNLGHNQARMAFMARPRSA